MSRKEPEQPFEAGRPALPAQQPAAAALPFEPFLRFTLALVRAIGTVVGTSAIAGLAIGGLWIVLGWMRFYGLEAGVVAQALPVESIDYHNALLNMTASLIDWYNGFFQGNSRFGSGIGLMAGASLSLLFLRKDLLPKTRLIAVFVAGAIFGGRLCLTFTSAPLPFLICAAVVALLFVAIASFSEEKLAVLPAVR